VSLLIGLQVPFTYSLSSRNPFRNLFKYLLSKAAMDCQKNLLMQNAARVQWEDAQLWISEEEEFLMNPFEPRF
jgi:hypothetical protein